MVTIGKNSKNWNELKSMAIGVYNEKGIAAKYIYGVLIFIVLFLIHELI